MFVFGVYCKRTPSYKNVRKCFILEKERMCFVFMITAKMMGHRKPERKKPASLVILTFEFFKNTSLF